MRKLPIGIDNFKKIIEGGYYYVDKSMLIADILEQSSEAFIFNRPRRFGKTVTSTMLFSFFDIMHTDQHRKLFEHLEIAKTEYFAEQGQSPVVYFSFKDMGSTNITEFKTAFFKAVRYYLSECSFLYERLSKGDQEVYTDLTQNSNSIFLNNALFFLTKFFYAYFGRPVILLVDEVEKPGYDSYWHNYYEELSDFLRVLYSSSLRGNPYLRFAVLFGIMRSTQDGFFTELVNNKFCTVLDSGFDDRFGFTKEEVAASLDEYGYDDQLDSVLEWYGGYRIGGTTVCNPWSVINFLQTGNLSPYWVNSVSEDLIEIIFRLSHDTVYKDMNTLFNGESIKKFIVRNLSFPVVMQQKKIWSLLLYNGYLTLDSHQDESDYCYIRLPNIELFNFFQNGFLEKFVGLNNFHFEELLNSLRGSNIKGDHSFESNMQEIFTKKISEYEVDNRETFYYGFMACMVLALKEEYKCYSTIEGKTEKIELILIPKDKKREGYVFAFKVIDIGGSFKETMEEALKGIEQKKYKALFLENGVKKAAAVAVSFYEDTLRVLYRNM